MKKDIENKEDIERMVRHFYQKVIADDVIGFIFTDIAKVNWEHHLPVMFTFWENVIFYTGGYDGNPIEIHKHLNRLYPLKTMHFIRWNELFEKSVDELFAGINASLAKQRALSISTVLQIKILQNNAATE